MKRCVLAVLLALGLAAPVAAQVIDTQYVSATSSDCSTASSCASFNPGATPAISYSISGTFSATLTFEGTSDGITWVSVNVVNVATSANSTTTTAGGVFAFANSGFVLVRVRCSSYTSGTARISATRGFATARLFSPVVTSLFLGDGSQAAPSLSFSAAPTIGFYRLDAASVGYSAGNTDVMRFDANGLTFNTVSQLSWTSGSSSTTKDTILVRDAANSLALKNGANAQTFSVYGAVTGTKAIFIKHDGTNGIVDTTASAGALNIAPTNASAVSIGKVISSLAGVATAGSFGTAPIVAVNETQGNTAAITNAINYTPAAVSSTYRLSGVVNVTAWATPASFTVALTYKDASGNARTETAMLIRGSNGTSAAAVTAVDRWMFTFPSIDIDNTATVITLSTTGTFTGSPVYNFQSTLERIR